MWGAKMGVLHGRASWFFFALTAWVWLTSNASVAAACKIEKRATVPLGRSGHMATVEVQINGEPVTLGIDTGAWTVITPETAEGLDLDQDRKRVQLRGTTGLVTGNTVTLKDLQFAGEHLRFKTVPEVALPQPGFGGEIDGLLGVDVLSRYDIEIDFQKATLNLYRVHGCASIAPEWVGDYTKTPIEIVSYQKIIVPVELDGVKLRALFDTGAVFSTLYRSALHRFGLHEGDFKNDSKISLRGVGDVAETVPFHKFRSFSAAGLTIPNQPLTILRSASSGGADMLLGRDVMRLNKFWISYATRTLFVQKQQEEAPIIAPSTVSPPQIPPTRIDYDIADHIRMGYTYKAQGKFEDAIKEFKAALDARPQATRSQSWGDVEFRIASAYLERTDGTRAENLEQAIQAGQEAVSLLDSTATLWIDAQILLGRSYIERQLGDRADNIEKGLSALVASLSRLAPTNARWKEVQTDIGNAYLMRLKGDKQENQRLAELALKGQLKPKQDQNTETTDSWHSRRASYRKH